jgi:plastocyanin
MTSPTTLDLPAKRTPRRIRPAHVLGAALALTALIMVVGAPAPWPQGEAAVTTVGVGAGGDAFGPNAVTIAQGDTITWNWVGGKHSVTSTTPSESFDSGSLTAGTFAHTFNQAGTFKYLCIWHPGMTGTVVVTAAPAAATTASGAAGAAGSGTAASGGSAGRPGAAPVAAGAAPKLARVRLAGTRMAFSLDNPATVATVAIGGRKTTAIGKVDANVGRGSMPLALNRLRVGRYTLVVSAKNTAGRSARMRVRVRVTSRLRQRSLLAQKALAAKAAAPVASAGVPVVGGAAAAPVSAPAPQASAPPTDTPAAPAPPVCDKAHTDHSGHGHGIADPRCDSGGGSGGSGSGSGGS